MAYRLAFRLSDNIDPEERLEEAAMWKAMYDEYGGDAIVGLAENEAAPPDIPVYGREKRFERKPRNPVSSRLPYWEDPAFLKRCGREFHVVPYEDASAAVRRLHDKGKDAFVKSTALKDLTMTVPAGMSLEDALGDLAYSYIDGGPLLMVQEHVAMAFEHRFFVIGRRIVTESPVQTALTPLDFPLPPGTCFRSPMTDRSEQKPGIAEALRMLVEETAAAMVPDHAGIDAAMVGNEAVLIEMNPMRIGQIGLYACDVRALAAASRALTDGYLPRPPLWTIKEDVVEEEFDDGAPSPIPG